MTRIEETRARVIQVETRRTPEADRTEHAHQRRTYFAAQSPRGFGNEIAVHRFGSKADRDAWVDDHRHDGDCNSASLGAYAVSARDARRISNYRGDAVTESFNSELDHDELGAYGG